MQLTHLLRDVLHGWGQLLMCVNVSPTAKDFEATVDTLRYATLARRIGTAARAQPPARFIRSACSCVALGSAMYLQRD